jgi:hypothetical protein
VEELRVLGLWWVVVDLWVLGVWFRVRGVFVGFHHANCGANLLVRMWLFAGAMWWIAGASCVRFCRRVELCRFK